MNRREIQLRASCAAFVIASTCMATAATAAVAQPTVPPGSAAAEATAPGQEIVVTGSRIRRDPLAQDSPVVTLDQESLAKTGLSAVADVLQRLPSAAGGLNSKVNNSGNLGNPPDGGGVGAGSAEIDLRYLGAKRTLVLVDGLRFVNATSASGIPATVDLNTIPANMIDRIEVLQAGASPLYGSDAIAGVVNVITVSQQKGLRLSAQYGQFLKYGDGKTQDYQASWGNGSSGPVQLAVGGAFVKQEAVRSANRSISQFPNPGQTSCSNGGGGCSSAALNGRFDTRGSAGPQPGLPFGNFTISNPPDNTPTLAELRPFTTADRFNFAPFQYILTPSKRYGAWISAKSEIFPATHFRLRASWNRRNSQNQAAFEPLFIGPDAGNGAGSLFDTLSVDATNPFNPFGATLESGLNANGTPNGRTPTYSFIARRLVEAGQRTFNQRVNTYSVNATIDGKVPLFGHDWFWDVNAIYGLNKARQSFTGNVRADRVAQAIGPIANCTGACVPLNLFGGAGSITPAMLNWIAFTEHDRSQQKLAGVTANLTGDLVELPAGPIGVALGVEHRYQSAYFTPDPIVSAGLGADIPAQPASGHYNVDEIYGEMRVPILKEQPFAYALEVNGAVRHSKYSISGGATTYTVTGLWKPVQDLLLRGAYSTGFRAPSLGELFGGRSRFDLPANDPCTSAAGGLFPTNATVRANCIANGVPSNGSYAEDQGGQLPVITQGNRNLRPEKSRNFTTGVVFAPQWARRNGSNFNVEVNYSDIKLTNAIGAVDPNVTLNNCALLGDAASCALVKRTANGFINEIDGTLGNLDSIRTKSIDATLNYRSSPSSIGRFGISANASHLLKYVLTASNGFVVIDRKGTERGSPDQAYPRWKGNATLDWSLGNLDVALTGRYIASVRETDNGNKLNNRLYTDVQVSFLPTMIDRRLALTVGVNNLFDKDPPACFSCSVNNYDPTTYDVPGRFGYVRLSYKM
ncbi:TonB-dependent receptor [Sphingomonas sp. KRR8]|uniref:TonB-dependent receptor domain-containing protein n=1 Tax=Sphingomonas sp. KRR8 TaxID=2942996 RepID=UPI0020202ECD|nr:TonB-dependent receptor [Sphingomonas sp. KRR8]URD61788.1 TonB-dependent receptor [Sphingomonas sp. KRR8]